MRVRLSPAPLLYYHFFMEYGDIGGERAPFVEQSNGVLLTNVISGDKFQRALISASRKTAKIGYETQFETYLDPTKQVYIPEVVMGGTVKMGGDSPVERILKIDDDSFINQNLSAYYINLHFHPDDNLTPSRRDLEFSFGRSKAIPLDKPAYMLIATVDKSRQRRIKILCVNSPKYYLIPEDLNQYDKEARHIGFDISKVITALGKIGLTAYIINMERDLSSDKLRYILTEDSKREINNKPHPEMSYKYQY